MSPGAAAARELDRLGARDLAGFWRRGILYWNTGRSSRYGAARAALRRRAAYEALADAAAPDALSLACRGRARRLLGRRSEARRDLSRAAALEPRLACARAWLWELEVAAGRPEDLSGIDAAIALEPREPRWLWWRAAGRVVLSADALRGRLKGRGDEGAPAAVARAARASLRDLDRALKRDPRRAPAWVTRALILARLGRTEAALDALDRAVALEPREACLRHLRSRLRLRAGRVDDSVEDAERACLLDEGTGYFKELAALRPDADAAWLLVFRGNHRRSPELNDFSGAAEDLERAAALSPRRAWAWAYLSRARLTAGRGLEARRAIETALRLAPRVGWLHVWRGEVRRRLGDARGALADFERGLSLDPDYEFGYAWRGGALRSLGKPAEALADLDHAAALDPTYAWTRHERFLCLRALGRTSEALEALEQACRLDPKYGYCAKPHDAPAALVELGRELEARPGSASAWAWRGAVRLLAQDHAGAVADLDRALSLSPRAARARVWRARALARLGRRERALLDLRLAVRDEPSCSDAHAWLGRLLLDAGRGAEAARSLGRAARLDPKSAWILGWQGEAEGARGRRAAALSALTRALELDPGHGPALLRRAALFKEAGRNDEARRDLERAMAAAVPGGRRA